MRGIEVHADGSLGVINTALGDFGPSVGDINFTANQNLLFLEVPMAMLGFDEGFLNYRLEMYNVINDQYSALGTTHTLGSYYDGYSTVVPEPATVLMMLVGLAGVGFVAVRRSL